MALPRLPAVTLRGAALEEAGLFQTVIELHLEVENPNPFALPTGRLAYDLTVAGSPVARAAVASAAANHAPSCIVSRASPWMN